MDKTKFNKEDVLCLTPLSVSNWQSTALDAPILIVNPAATLHQRAALSWSMAIETLNILEAMQAAFGENSKNDAAMLCVLIERTRQLEALLEDVGARTADLEGGAA